MHLEPIGADSNCCTPHLQASHRATCTSSTTWEGAIMQRHFTQTSQKYTSTDTKDGLTHCCIGVSSRHCKCCIHLTSNPQTNTTCPVGNIREELRQTKCCSGAVNPTLLRYSVRAVHCLLHGILCATTFNCCGELLTHVAPWRTTRPLTYRRGIHRRWRMPAHQTVGRRHPEPRRVR